MAARGHPFVYQTPGPTTPSVGVLGIAQHVAGNDFKFPDACRDRAWEKPPTVKADLYFELREPGRVSVYLASEFYERVNAALEDEKRRLDFDLTISKGRFDPKQTIHVPETAWAFVTDHLTASPLWIWAEPDLIELWSEAKRREKVADARSRQAMGQSKHIGGNLMLRLARSGPRFYTKSPAGQALESASRNLISRLFLHNLGMQTPIDISQVLRPVGRWVSRRKEVLIRAIDAGYLTELQACAMHGISLEELSSWRRALGSDGRPGLQVYKTGARAEPIP